MKHLQLKQIGSFIKVHGVHGELVLNLKENYTFELIEKVIKEGEPVFVEINGIPVPFFISVNGFEEFNQNSTLLKLDDIDNKKALQMVSSKVFLESYRLSKTKDNKFDSPEDLLGYTVTDIKASFKGKVSEFINLKGNPMLNISVGKKNMLLPVISDFVVSIDDLKHEILLDLPDGYLEAML